MEPGYLCSKLLHNWLVVPRLGESPQVLEVPGRATLGAGNSVLLYGTSFTKRSARTIASTSGLAEG
jgi:hypothetical protein